MAYVIQQGSTPDFRVSDQNRWYVIKETWEGPRLVNQTIIATFPTREEAVQKRRELMKKQ